MTKAKQKITHGSLFSGIGGFDLAAQWCGWKNVFQVEWDDYCQKVLAKNFPNTKRYGDIKEFDGTKYAGTVDIISGGFPCQPFSAAGKRKGKEDDRYLWPEMLRVISEAKPSFVVGENVAGLISMDNGRTLDTICTQMENEGYAVELFVIPACAAGAWHRRDRLWIVAYTGSARRQQNTQSSLENEGANEGRTAKKDNQPQCDGESSRNGHATNPSPAGLSTPKQKVLQGTGRRKEGRTTTQCDWWSSEPNVGRVANGVPRRVDRLKGLGNAVVPQIPYVIFQAIERAMNHDQN